MKKESRKRKAKEENKNKKKDGEKTGGRKSETGTTPKPPADHSAAAVKRARETERKEQVTGPGLVRWRGRGGESEKR